MSFGDSENLSLVEFKVRNNETVGGVKCAIKEIQVNAQMIIRELIEAVERGNIYRTESKRNKRDWSAQVKCRFCILNTIRHCNEVALQPKSGKSQMIVWFAFLYLKMIQVPVVASLSQPVTSH